MKARILIAVEDDDSICDLLTEVCKGSYIVERALNIDDVHEIIRRRGQADVMVVSGRHQRSALAPAELVREIRKFYQGFMIAFSGDGDACQELVAAGCNEMAVKPDVPRLRAILGIEEGPVGER